LASVEIILVVVDPTRDREFGDKILEVTRPSITPWRENQKENKERNFNLKK